jgi:hypothetical protein
VASLREAADNLANGAGGESGESRAALEQREKDIERRNRTLLDLRLGAHITEAEFAAKRSELVTEQAKAREQLAAFELDTVDPREAVEWFIRTCNDLPALFADGTDSEIRRLLRIVGSNYRFGGGTVDFEPVKPFDLASRVRNRPIWRAEQSDVRTIVQHLQTLSVTTAQSAQPMTELFAALRSSTFDLCYP